MDDLLIHNPKKYILNFIGLKNEQELAVAIEIYLAEKVFEPKFNCGYDYEKMKAIDLEVTQSYAELGKQDLTVLFYFNYMNFAVETGLVKQSLINDYGVFVANRILRESDNSSRIAKNLLKSNDFYKSVHKEKTEGLGDVKSLEKVMGLITLQNKELYRLEMERLRSFEEYDVFEKYRSELENAEERIINEFSSSKVGW